MTERDILSDPILTDIYERMIDGWQYSDQALRIKRQAIELIKQLLLRNLLDHYNAPKFFYLTLTDNITEKLRKYFKQKYEYTGQNVSDKDIEEAVNNIVEHCTLFTNQQIAKGAKNA